MPSLPNYLTVISQSLWVNHKFYGLTLTQDSNRPGHTFIGELSRRMRASVPYSLLPHASWATPRLGPMIRMALTHAVRRGLAASVHTNWRRGDGGGGDSDDD